MISVIIPVYNEAENIGRLVHYLKEQSAGYVTEIIVVDGGSTDHTRALLKCDSAITLVSSPKGRAKQMNAGARVAKGEILYFLHADSFPPTYFDRYIITAFDAGHPAGCFMLKFDYDHWWLRFMGWCTAINHICCRGGDQSLFVFNETFWKLGGFNEDYLIYEDNELIKRLYASVRFKVIKKRLITSARHYQRIGVWKLQWVYLQIYWKKRIGAKPDQLYQLYKGKMATWDLGQRTHGYKHLNHEKTG